MTERLGPPDIDHGKTAPLFLCHSISAMRRDRPELIAGSGTGRSFEFSFLGIQFYNPSFVKVLIPNLGHFPGDDSGLPDNQIVINDKDNSLVVKLPNSFQLNSLNDYRRLAGLSSLSLSDLRELQWRGQVVLFNQYLQGQRDKYTLIYLAESAIQAREGSRSYQSGNMQLEGI